MPYLANLTTSSSPLLYVNAGANKGFAVAEFLQRFHDNGGTAPTNAQWHLARPKACARVKGPYPYGRRRSWV